jgi:hypothetical protein
VVEVANKKDKKDGGLEGDVDITSSAVFVIALILLFAVGGSLFFGSSIVISAVSSNPMLNIVSAQAQIPTSIPRPNTTISTPTPTPDVAATATPTRPLEYVKVAHTDSEGVYLRRTPRSADKMSPWMEGTIMQVVGDDREAEGTVWRNVQDPKGAVGWIQSQYLEPYTP